MNEEQRKRIEAMSVCIVVPCASYQTSAKFMKSLVNMVTYSWTQGLKIHMLGMTERVVVDWARNDLAKTASNHICDYTGEKFTHLLWLDDDHVFNPEMAVELAKHDHDMVSATYFGRTSPYYPVVYVKDDTDDKYKHFPLIEVPNAVFPVDAVGFGALLMKRDVFDRVPEPWFTLDYNSGEDIAFCVKAKEYGIGIYCHGGYKLGHIGPPNIVTEKTYKEFQKSNPEQFEDKIRVTLNGA